LVAELEPVSTAARHLLEAEIEGDVWCIADEERALQVGRALVVNALVHTAAGTRVVLRVRRRDHRAELAVEDNGAGIPVEHQEAVFQRFYRVEGGVASGSGLGLAIAKEVARLMDGSVRLESMPGRTVFTLDLPGEAQLAPATPRALAFPRENAGAAPTR
jgi:two-component system OmpR family sensor kinase